MGELAQIQFGRIFDSYERDLRHMQRDALVESGKILRREQESSMRRRWYRTGASVEALGQGEIIEEGDSVTFRLVTGKFYDIFGEYGTGQRGAATGQPVPPFYRYGSKSGMGARRFSRLAIDAATPQIRDLHLLKTRQFARGG